MSIPEFVLKKLIVPGSLITRPNGFSFKLLNSFAPATITRFSLFIADNEVSEDCVTFESAVSPVTTGAGINPEFPIELPVGIEITIAVYEHPLTGPVKVVATTKEVGDLEFTISSGVKKKKSNKLNCAPLVCFMKPIKASIQINTQEIKAEASPYLLGHFIEHLERCIYDGIWTSAGSELRQDTLDLIKQLNPPIIRYPGGNFASGYHWEDGIGPKDKRPRRHDPSWQAEESNMVGTDEFLAFCEQIQTQPLLVVNDGSGTPEEAARWVAYCNSPADSVQGKIRAIYGHPEPYNVKYWGVGNEVWGPWQIGSTGAEEYAKRFLRFVKAMKEVDPEIKIVAVGNHPLTDDPNDPAALWNETLLTKASKYIDYLSWHIYQPEKSGWKEEYDPLDLYKAICAAPIDLDKIIKRVHSQIEKFTKGKEILQALDEWNLWLPPLQENTSMHNVTYRMRDALYVASALIVFFNNSDILGMANLAQMVNVLPLIQTNTDTAIATAIFYPFILFGQIGHFPVKTIVNSDTFDSPELDINILAHQDVPYLDGICTVNESEQKASVLLVNRHPCKKMRVEISFENQTGFLPREALSISANNSMAFNSFSKPHNVKIMDAKTPILSEHTFQVILKPSSIYLAQFERTETQKK